jgi:hypothetical protein
MFPALALTGALVAADVVWNFLSGKLSDAAEAWTPARLTVPALAMVILPLELGRKSASLGMNGAVREVIISVGACTLVLLAVVGARRLMRRARRH